jgi:glycosyltransferase involved in cell wall biosynthesis
VDAAALMHARRSDSDLAFVLVGDEQARSPYRAELRALIDSHGLSDCVIVAGHCDDMPAAYKAACLTVLPSIEPEAFGRAAVEAQAMGCPVIASRIGAFPETVGAEPTLLARVASVPESVGPEPQAVSQRGNPWLFEPGNREALCESLCAAVALSGDALETLRTRNMERVRASFSKRALQLQTLSVYDRLIGTQLAAAFKAATQK